MLNEKMDEVAKSIGGVIWNYYPINYLNRVFSFGITDDDVVQQVLFECCKYAYDYYDGDPTEILGKHSLRYYLPKNEDLTGASDENAERLIRQRTLKNINEWKMKYAKFMKKYIGTTAELYEPPSMKDADEKFFGYGFTPFQYWEINDYYENKIESDIVRQHIANKNYKYEVFIDNIADYDKSLISIKNDASLTDEMMVMSTLKAFVLEWRYCISFYYNIATKMEEEKIRRIPDLTKKKSLYAGSVEIVSDIQFYEPRINPIIRTDSRLLKVRNRFVREIVDSPEAIYDEKTNSYKEAIFMVGNLITNMTYKGINIREWFLKSTSVEDWDSVFRRYDIFSITPCDKKWTRQKYRNMKYLLLAGTVSLKMI